MEARARLEYQERAGLDKVARSTLHMVRGRQEVCDPQVAGDMISWISSVVVSDDICGWNTDDTCCRKVVTICWTEVTSLGGRTTKGTNEGLA
ncbi:hypothetical protein ACLOJK_035092, partial [Asimina triloba]